MPIVAAAYRFVTGVDTHARTHALAIFDTSSGKQVGAAAFPATPAGYRRAGAWLTRRTRDPRGVLVCMEGTNWYGARLNEQLASCAFRVVEAPGPSRALHRWKGRGDELDARRAAQAVLPLPIDALTEPRARGAVTALRVLSVARDGAAPFLWTGFGGVSHAAACSRAYRVS